ncbi:MAG TPA: beta-CASP ribonuclease aCPSF1 [Candidatus Bathyarchaeota archaeon]|nr:beta-CASP ribonuclease aCPSF1 [Candidatus Bathyarchaeota archaeon]
MSISNQILQRIPKEAEITRIEYEGPAVAIYAKRPEVLIEKGSVISEIVSAIRKRIVVRSDPSVRKPEKEAESIILGLIPREAEVTNIKFDPSLGEAIIEARKPGLAIGKNGVILQKIVKYTKWRPRVLRTPPIHSKIIAQLRHYLYKESKERENILHSVGERIFRPLKLEIGDICITALGGFREVGRSAILVRTRESQVLLDCGVNLGAEKPIDSFPRLDQQQFDLESLDAVVVSHAHLDHCGFVPYLYKYGYEGPVYCSEPTQALMTLLQLDYLDVASKQGFIPPYGQKDVRETAIHTIPLAYGAVTDISPDIRLTLHNAGHILGSSIIHLHIGEGIHNIVYTGDYKYAKTLLLEPAATEFPRVETIITESTYGSPQDVMPSRRDSEKRFIDILNKTLEGGGKVLIPVPAVGRAQEIMLIIDNYIRKGMLKEVPVFIEGMISEATAIHTAYPEYLGREVYGKMVYENVNPFKSDYFTIVEHPSARDEIVEGEPCIIMATSGMLEGGPVIEYFTQLAEDKKNTIVFVSYQIEGTLGSRILKGVKEVSMLTSEGKMRVIRLRMNVEYIKGFSGHSDRRELMKYLQKFSPKLERIIVCHGEKSKALSFAETLRKRFKTEVLVPEVLETVRLK